MINITKDEMTRRWLVTALKAQILTVKETLKHQPDSPGKLYLDITRGILIYGIAFLPVVGIMFAGLAHDCMSGSDQTITASGNHPDG